MPLLAFLEGRLLAIEDTREASVHENVIRFNRATFLTAFGANLKMGTMILWEEEVKMLYDLRLGHNYQFVAGLEIEGDLFLLYFLPGTTRFEEPSQRTCQQREVE